jgi:hypothetical protein
MEVQVLLSKGPSAVEVSLLKMPPLSISFLPFQQASS